MGAANTGHGQLANRHMLLLLLWLPINARSKLRMNRPSIDSLMLLLNLRVVLLMLAVYRRYLWLILRSGVAGRAKRRRGAVLNWRSESCRLRYSKWVLILVARGITCSYLIMPLGHGILSIGILCGFGCVKKAVSRLLVVRGMQMRAKVIVLGNAEGEPAVGGRVWLSCMMLMLFLIERGVDR